MADSVDDEEMLYRSVKKDQYEIVEGNVRLLSTAFSDRECRISFDRAKYRSIESAQKSRDQSVFELNAGDVRNIKGVIINEHMYRVEVFASPLQDNPAHAHVEALPLDRNIPVLSQTGFKKLQRELTKIAKLKLNPSVF